MQSSADARREPLPHGGIDVLTELITHQDTTTWTAITVFMAAEFLLLALYLQSTPSLGVIGTVGTFGIVTTVTSWTLIERSQRYLRGYFDMAKRRCSPEDHEIFDVQLRGLPRTTLVLRILHIAFLALWALLYGAYILIVWHVFG